MTRRGGTGRALIAPALLVVSLLAGCSDDSSESPAKHTAGSPTTTSTRSPTSPTTAYPTGAPTGTDLTEPGSELDLGQPATVTWQPRQNVAGTVTITVEKVERTSFKKSFLDWRIDARMRTYTPYFVHAHVTNLGPTDLAAVPVPLYGESAANALVEPAVFKETFKPCHPSTLPRPFAAGASTRTCLVYLVPNRGALVGAAFRPTQDFDPIVWRPATPTAAPTTGSPTASPTTSPTA